MNGRVANGIAPSNSRPMGRKGSEKSGLIERRIVDICNAIPIHFVIADGIFPMEGNGPLAGSPRHLGKLVLADDSVAADATCARLMGLAPEHTNRIRAAAMFVGNSSAKFIDMLGEALSPPERRFHLVKEFLHLYSDHV